MGDRDFQNGFNDRDGLRSIVAYKGPVLTHGRRHTVHDYHDLSEYEVGQ